MSLPALFCGITNGHEAYKLIIDYVFTGIGALCTVASIIGACKSNKYYKMSKNITLFANSNVAYLESQKIIDTFTQLLKLTNPKIPQRGTNIPRVVSQYGEDIKTSVSVIKEKLTTDDVEKIEAILQKSTINISRYIDSIIACATLKDGKFVLDDDFNKAQEAFYEVQKYLKSRSEKLEDTIKS